MKGKTVQAAKRLLKNLLLRAIEPRSAALSDFGKHLLYVGLKNRVRLRKSRMKERLILPAKRAGATSVICQTEFGPELKWYVPFAYWHYLNGTLGGTASMKDTSPFYFFSPNHRESSAQRRYWFQEGIPNAEDHNFSYDLSHWARVPFKKVYSGQFVPSGSKPLLVISNKFNTEWNHEPVNFIGLELLREICRMLTRRYHVVYNRPGSGNIVMDNSVIRPFKDKELLKVEFPEVSLAEELYGEARGRYNNFNHFQLALYSACERFLSVQGGNSVLASYFEGTNIVLVKEGQELAFGEYEHFYPLLSGAKIILCTTDDEFLLRVQAEYCGSGWLDRQ